MKITNYLKLCKNLLKNSADWKCSEGCIWWWKIVRTKRATILGVKIDRSAETEQSEQGRVNSEAAMSNPMTKQKYSMHVLKICTWSHSSSWIVWEKSWYASSAMLFLLCFICYALSAMLYLLCFICYACIAMLYLLCFI